MMSRTEMSALRVTRTMAVSRTRRSPKSRGAKCATSGAVSASFCTPSTVTSAVLIRCAQSRNSAQVKPPSTDRP